MDGRRGKKMKEEVTKGMREEVRERKENNLKTTKWRENKSSKLGKRVRHLQNTDHTTTLSLPLTSCVYVRTGTPKALANPKSASLMCPCVLMRRFCGFRSRCKTRCE